LGVELIDIAVHPGFCATPRGAQGGYFFDFCYAPVGTCMET
jgi:hypothetical protein